MTTVTHVENGGTFVCTAKLQVCISHFFATAFGAGLVYNHVGLDIVSRDGLDAGLQLLSEKRRKVGRFGLGDGCLGSGIYWKPNISSVPSLCT